MKARWVFVLLLAVPGNAAEVCLQNSAVLECFPGDLGYPMDWVGFSSSGAPCGMTYGQAVPGYSISASATESDQNEGDVPGDSRLYLWLTPLQAASAPAAYGGLGYFHAEFTGDLEVVDYEHVASGTFSWDPDAHMLFFQLPCLTDIQETLVGILQVGTAVSTDPAVEADSWGGIKSLYR
jgi:hypothetical protein